MLTFSCKVCNNGSHSGYGDKSPYLEGLPLLLRFLLVYMPKYSIYGLYLIFCTGNKDADEVLKILLGNPNMFGGVLACILDNTVPGKCRCMIGDFQYDDLTCKKHFRRNMRFPTIWHVRPAKAQISLRICAAMIRAFASR